MSFGYLEALNYSDRARYLAKLTLTALSAGTCPYKIPAGSWVDNPTKWPGIEWPDVSYYLIETPGVFTRESMRNRRSLEAHNQFESGWVKTVLYYKPTDSPHCILKADVTPSQRVNDTPHHPWIALHEKDRVVTAAHCDCMAWLGESCSHVAALLFKVEAAVRLGYTRRACTELPCYWNNDFVKKVKPAPVHGIQFYKKSATEMFRKRSKQNRYAAPSISTDREQKQLLDSLASCSRQPIGLSLFKEHCSPFCWTATVELERLPRQLTSLYKLDYASITLTELHCEVEEALASLTVTDAEVRYLEKSTVNQAACLTWFQMRAGRITASRAHLVLHTRLDHPSASLVKDICSDSGKSFYSAATMWGKGHEADALSAYSNIGGHTNFQLSKTGLRLCKEFPYIGASADGLASCDCHSGRVVEVKCPFKHRNSSLDTMTADPSFCLGKDLNLKCGHTYYAQVQLQMYVYNLSMCDFVVWTSVVCVVVGVPRDADFVSDMVPKLCTFFKRCVMPELLTRNMQHASSSHTQSPAVSDVVSEKLYCSCRMPANDSDLDDDMLGCDSPNCPHGEWFHFTCVKVKRVPKGSWFCPLCRKTPK